MLLQPVIGPCGHTRLLVNFVCTICSIKNSLTDHRMNVSVIRKIDREEKNKDRHLFQQGVQAVWEIIHAGSY